MRAASRRPITRPRSPRQPSPAARRADVEERRVRLRPEETRIILAELFEMHWHEIRFGILGGGAEWEIRVAQPPRLVPLKDGTVTIHFGGWHLHLRVGDRAGLDGPDPERVQALIFFRLLDEERSPTEWGLAFVNGRGEQQMTVLLPNPLRGEEDRPLPRPDWTRLALWNSLAPPLRRRDGGGRPRMRRRSGRSCQVWAGERHGVAPHPARARCPPEPGRASLRSMSAPTSFVLMLADREEIASLSYYAADPSFSHLRERARGHSHQPWPGRGAARRGADPGGGRRLQQPGDAGPARPARHPGAAARRADRFRRRSGRRSCRWRGRSGIPTGARCWWRSSTRSLAALESGRPERRPLAAVYQENGITPGKRHAGRCGDRRGWSGESRQPPRTSGYAALP